MQQPFCLLSSSDQRTACKKTVSLISRSEKKKGYNKKNDICFVSSYIWGNLSIVITLVPSPTCKIFFFYVPCFFRTREIIAPHNFLSFVHLSKVIFLAISPKHSYDNGLQKVISYVPSPFSSCFQYCRWVSKFLSPLSSLYTLEISTVSFRC